MTEYQDKRHNKEPLEGDKAFDEIKHHLEKYRNAEKRFSTPHKVTRRLALHSIFWVVFSLTLIYSNSLFDINLVDTNPFLLRAFDIVNWQLTLFWPVAVVFFFLESFNKWVKTLFITQAILLGVFYSKETLAAICTVHIAVFVVTYAANRMLGYTRAWSRNRTMVYHLERLEREHQLSVINADKRTIEIEQENTLTKLFSLEEANVNSANQDIVGDYFSVADGAIGWVKGFKK
ncbi:hypothetical protein [Vibrio sp. 10N.222.55.A1]|uniref:hypothetical protein n=1 Tax=Vibrio sp. 10N.222.55.A1 TaxID=3229646 RepID=UPI0035542B26